MHTHHPTPIESPYTHRITLYPWKGAGYAFWARETTTVYGSFTAGWAPMYATGHAGEDGLLVAWGQVEEWHGQRQLQDGTLQQGAPCALAAVLRAGDS